AQGPRMSRRAEATPAEQVRKAEAEHAEVLRAHDEAGAPLLAPNGEPSQLNRNQWVQVRTDNFKQWFGDWEGSPETSSKVVDANGEPVVVYHGTARDFEQFDLSASQVSGDVGPLGVFFTDNPDYASAYAADIKGQVLDGGQVMPAFISLKNPKIESIDLMEDIEVSWDKKAVAEYKDSLLREGHDGIIFQSEGANEYVAFEPTQIKSAIGNRGTFDPANPDIRYSRTNDKAGEQSVEAYKESWVEDFLKQPVDRVFRIPAQIVGGLDSQGRWKPGVKADDAMRKAVTEWKPKEDGMFGWLNTPLEKARA